ncbi:hypothetical protein GS506_20345 [Rhodococcus hoagii]|nr:hypothetical protein [Prescottella equi]
MLLKPRETLHQRREWFVPVLCAERVRPETVTGSTTAGFRDRDASLDGPGVGGSLDPYG